MNLPNYTFPIFYSAIFLMAFVAFFPTSTSLLVMVILLPALVLYQAYIILKDGSVEGEKDV